MGRYGVMARQRLGMECDAVFGRKNNPILLQFQEFWYICSSGIDIQKHITI